MREATRFICVEHSQASFVIFFLVQNSSGLHSIYVALAVVSNLDRIRSSQWGVHNSKYMVCACVHMHSHLGYRQIFLFLYMRNPRTFGS